VNTSTSVTNCGECGKACVAGATCSGGTCLGGTGGAASGGTSSGGVAVGGGNTGGRASGGTPSGGTPGNTPCAPATEQATGACTDFKTTGAYCMKTSATIAGWGCSNFTGRTLKVNNTTISSCGDPLPGKWTDGYYYFDVSAGSLSYACVYWW
jgi:hypothetical protein